MLVIRRKQMEVLGDYVQRQFEHRMKEQLRTLWREEVGQMSDEELHALIREGITSAESYGITDETDVERYLELMVRRGARFHVEEAWAAGILFNENLSGTQKMDQIDDYELFVLEDSIGGGGSD